MVSDTPKNISELSEEFKKKSESKGLIESHIRTFFISKVNKAGLSEDFLRIATIISRYSKGNLKDIIEAKKKELQNKGFSYSELSNKGEGEDGKIHSLWDYSIEYSEKIDQENYKCVEFVNKKIWVRTCCIYFIKTWEETCSEHLNSNAEYTAKNINAYYG